MAQDTWQNFSLDTVVTDPSRQKHVSLGGLQNSGDLTISWDHTKLLNLNQADVILREIRNGWISRGLK